MRKGKVCADISGIHFKSQTDQTTNVAATRISVTSGERMMQALTDTGSDVALAG